jgi:hypothetical protein
MPGTWVGTLWWSQQGQVSECLNRQELLFNWGIGQVHNSSATPDVLDILLTKYTFISVWQSTCSLLSLDHLPVLIDTKCRLFFVKLPGLPDFRRTDARPAWKMDFRPTGNSDDVAIDMCVEKLSSDLLEALAVSSPKSRPSDDPRPPISGRNVPEDLTETAANP